MAGSAEANFGSEDIWATTDSMNVSSAWCVAPISRSCLGWVNILNVVWVLFEKGCSFFQLYYYVIIRTRIINQQILCCVLIRELVALC